MDSKHAGPEPRGEGRDMEPLSERPGYNAKPTDWVRYANYLEIVVTKQQGKLVEIEKELDRFRGPLMTQAYGHLAAAECELDALREVAQAVVDGARRRGVHNLSSVYTVEIERLRCVLRGEA